MTYPFENNIHAKLYLLIYLINLLSKFGSTELKRDLYVSFEEQRNNYFGDFSEPFNKSVFASHRNDQIHKVIYNDPRPYEMPAPTCDPVYAEVVKTTFKID